MHLYVSSQKDLFLELLITATWFSHTSACHVKFRLPLGIIWALFSLGHLLSPRGDFEGQAASHSILRASLTFLSFPPNEKGLSLSLLELEEKQPSFHSLRWASSSEPRSCVTPTPYALRFRSRPHRASWTFALSFLSIGDTHIRTGNTWYSRFTK